MWAMQRVNSLERRRSLPIDGNLLTITTIYALHSQGLVTIEASVSGMEHYTTWIRVSGLPDQ